MKNQNHKWNLIRNRHVPAILPIGVYFSWPISEMVEGGYFKIIGVWDDGNMQAMWDLECSIKLRKAFFDIIWKNKNNLQEFRKKAHPAGENLIKFCEGFAKNIDNKELKDYLKFFKEFTKLYHELMKKNMIFWTFGQTPTEEKINGLLKDHTEEERKDIFITMSTPKEPSYSKIEEEEFEKIVELAKTKGIKDKSVKNEIKKFSEKYFWFPYEYVGPDVWDEKRVTERVKQELNSKKEIFKHIDISKKQKKCIKKFNLSKEIIDLFNILQTLTLMQDDRKMYNSHICYYLQGTIIKKLAKLLKIDYKLVRYIEEELFKEFMDKNDLEWLKKKLEIRSRFTVHETFDDGKSRFHDGEKGRKFLEKQGVQLNADAQTDTIKGAIAYSGKIKGRVRILKTSSNVKDFKKGDILVTGMTTPDFVPLMKKVGAIVTDEGGITCHAAIVSRELRIPCVIGTKIATKILKDGDEVEVDADNGVVRKI